METPSPRASARDAAWSRVATWDPGDPGPALDPGDSDLDPRGPALDPGDPGPGRPLRAKALEPISGAGEAPEKPPRELASPWRALLSTLDNPTLDASAAFLSFEDGLLKVAVRDPIWKEKVEGLLRGSPAVTVVFPGLRGIDVKVDRVAGQTERERRLEREKNRFEDARRAAEESPAVKLLREALHARIDIVEARPLAERDKPAHQEDNDDE